MVFFFKIYIEREIEHSNIQINQNKTDPALLKYLNSVDTKYEYEYKNLKYQRKK